MKRKTLVLVLSLILVASFTVGAVVLPGEVLVVEPTDDTYKATVVETDVTITADNTSALVDMVVLSLEDYKCNLNKSKIEALEVQIAELQARVAALKAAANKELQIYALFDVKEQTVQKNMLKVLEDDTSIEKYFKRDVTRVSLKPAARGNPYGAKLSWTWDFGVFSGGN